MGICIKIDSLTKEYRISGEGKFKAVDNLTLEIEQGEIFGLLGPNGAGKTTTLNMLLGFISATSGNAWIFGERIGNVKIRRRISFLPEVPASYEYLNVEELLHFYGGLFGLKRLERSKKIDELLKIVDLGGSARRKKLSDLSKGMRQRVAIAESLLNAPDLLFMDEPASGLDPIGRREVRKLLIRLKEEGKTIFLCSHLLSEMEQVCTRVGILHDGNLLKVGHLSELLSPVYRTLEDLFIEIVEGKRNENCPDST